MPQREAAVSVFLRTRADHRVTADFFRVQTHFRLSAHTLSLAGTAHAEAFIVALDKCQQRPSLQPIVARGVRAR